MLLNRYRKFLSAVLVPALVFGLEAIGVDLPPGWAEGVVGVVTPILVFVIPNEA